MLQEINEKQQMTNLVEKKLIIREKRKLRQIAQYKPEFLRDSKSHTDRILEQNTRTLSKRIAERISILHSIKRTNCQKITGNKSCLDKARPIDKSSIRIAH